MFKFHIQTNIRSIAKSAPSTLVWFAGPIQSGKSTTMRTVEAMLHYVDPRSIFKNSAFRGGSVELQTPSSHTRYTHAYSSSLVNAKRQIPRTVASFIAADGIGDQRAKDAVLVIAQETGVPVPAIINDMSGAAAFIIDNYSSARDVFKGRVGEAAAKLIDEKSKAMEELESLKRDAAIEIARRELSSKLTEIRARVSAELLAAGLTSPFPRAGAVQASIIQGDPTLPCGLCATGSLPVRAQSLIEDVQQHYALEHQHVFSAYHSLSAAIDLLNQNKQLELTGAQVEAARNAVFKEESLARQISAYTLDLQRFNNLTGNIDTAIAKAWYGAAANTLREMLAPLGLSWEVSTGARYALQFRTSASGRWVDKYGMSGAELGAFKIAIQVAFVLNYARGRRVVFLDDEEMAGFAPSPEILAQILSYLTSAVAADKLDGVCIAGLQDAEIHSALAPVLRNFERIYINGATIF